MAHDVRYDEDEPNGMRQRRRAIQEHLARHQEGMTGESLDVLVGPVDSGAHGTVQGELRRIQVAVRGQMDGIRPVEAAVVTYRWPAVRVEVGGDPVQTGWAFEQLETLVQGLGGELKPGTVLTAEDYQTLGPSLGWAWDLVHALRPRG